MAETLTDIRIFIAAYEECSFTAAASREHATQSGVSQHIRKLEEDFGVSLFTRSKGKVVPTLAADAYYERCIQVLRTLSSGRNAVKAFAGVAGDVYVGLMPTMTRATLAPSIRRTVAEHPNITVQIVEGYSGILTERVINGELDFAIVPAFAGAPGLNLQPFLRTWETLVSNRARGSHLSPVRLQDSGPLRVVVPSRANTRRQTLEIYFKTNHVQIERIIELDTMMGALDFVGASEWVTIAPAIMMNGEIAGGQYAVRPIVGPIATLDLVLIEPMRSTLSVPAAAFLDILWSESKRLNEAWRQFMEGAAALEADSDRNAANG